MLFCPIIDFSVCPQQLADKLTILMFLLQDFELCVRAENVMLPNNGFFGLSAATGKLADDHDVFVCVFFTGF
jgi:Legume-like lectin family